MSKQVEVMRYKITITELRDSTQEYRSEDEYKIYEVKVDGDSSIVPAVQRVVLEYIEEGHRIGVLMQKSQS